MYDELVNRLRDFAVELRKAEDALLVRDAADAIEGLSEAYDKLSRHMDDLAALMPRWIPVNERLPEDLTRVIVFCEDGVSYGLCEHLIADDEEVVEWHDLLHYPITPTHWMPLPSAPMEE